MTDPYFKIQQVAFSTGVGIVAGASGTLKYSVGETALFGIALLVLALVSAVFVGWGRRDCTEVEG